MFHSTNKKIQSAGSSKTKMVAQPKQHGVDQAPVLKLPRYLIEQLCKEYLKSEDILSLRVTCHFFKINIPQSVVINAVKAASLNIYFHIRRLASTMPSLSVKCLVYGDEFRDKFNIIKEYLKNEPEENQCDRFSGTRLFTEGKNNQFNMSVELWNTSESFSSFNDTLRTNANIIFAVAEINDLKSLSETFSKKHDTSLKVALLHTSSPEKPNKTRIPELVDAISKQYDKDILFFYVDPTTGEYIEEAINQAVAVHLRTVATPAAAVETKHRCMLM